MSVATMIIVLLQLAQKLEHSEFSLHPVILKHLHVVTTNSLSQDNSHLNDSLFYHIFQLLDEFEELTGNLFQNGNRKNNGSRSGKMFVCYFYHDYEQQQ